MTFQGHIEKGMVVLEHLLPLPDGTPVVVEPITRASDFWEPHSLDELAKRQGVSAAASPDDLLGGWPVDEIDDDFEKALLSWRECELDNHA